MSTQAPITIQQLSLRLLHYIGISQFTPQTVGNELESYTPSVGYDVVNALNAAIQEITDVGPAEAKEAPGYGLLNQPTGITLNCTYGSTTVSAVTTWAAWMQGCTLQISGDTQQNELLSQTRLARPFLGTTGGATATIYGDCITLDDTIGKIIAPLWLPNNLPVYPATNRQQFMQLGMYPLVTSATGGILGWPFYLYYQKPIGPPRTWFIDGAYDASLGYTQRRIRFCPMPNQTYSVAYTAGINPPRMTLADVVSPLTTLVVIGATSNGGAANGTYSFVCDYGMFRLFANNSGSGPYYLYYHPTLNAYVIFASIVTVMFSPSSDEYWVANTATSPLGGFGPQGVATGNITVTTTDAGNGNGDPGTLIPIPNTWAENILLPVALKRFSGSPAFKNDRVLKQIDSDYQKALQTLQDSKGQEAISYATYI